MDNAGTVLVVGDFTGERVDISAQCARFGWDANFVRSLSSDMLESTKGVVAGIVDVTDNGAAIREARQIAPGVLWIACCRFSGAGAWLDSERDNIFHFIHRPLQVHEIQQSLGFVASRMNREERAELPVPDKKPKRMLRH